jgi:hypothetical protein
MESLPVPKTMKVYQLVRMSTKNGLNFGLSGSGTVGSTGYIGSGFFTSQSEAEQNRTMETLKDVDGNKFYVFELDFPNPAYKE